MEKTDPPDMSRFGFENENEDSPPKPKSSGSGEENNWSLFCHLSALAQFMVPFGNLAGPLILWLIKKDEMPTVDEHGKESLNFQISITLYLIVAGVLCIVLIGFVLLPAILLFQLIMIIVASAKAAGGGFYRYPLTIRMIK